MKIKLKPILLLVGALAIVYAGIFLLPNHIEALALIPEKFFSGEIWRLVTFQFTHLSELHLFENIAGVLLVGFLATELKIATSDFSFVYFLSGKFGTASYLYCCKFCSTWRFCCHIRCTRPDNAGSNKVYHQN